MRKITVKFPYSLEEIYLICFPIAILLRSAVLNLYMITGAIICLYNIISKKKITEKNLFAMLIIFFFYFLVNALFAENIHTSLKSSISQFRFVFFAFFISCLDLSKINFKKIIFSLSILINFVSFDTLYQYFFEHDFFGIEADPINNPLRLSGPFGKELIVGSFISILSIPLVGFTFFEYEKMKVFERLFFFMTLFLSFTTIILSGERISLAIFLFCLFLISFISMNLKKFLFIVISSLLILFLGYKNINSINYKFNEFAQHVFKMHKSEHGKLFSSALIVGKNKLFTGAGLENYREDCDLLLNKKYIDENTLEKILCSSHPHNLYLEIFAEGGIIGLAIFMLIIYKNFKFYQSIKNKINSNLKFLFYSSLAVLLAYLWPIKSSGSFFSTYNASFFWFYYGLFLLCSQNINSKNS